MFLLTSSVLKIRRYTHRDGDKGHGHGLQHHLRTLILCCRLAGRTRRPRFLRAYSCSATSRHGRHRTHRRYRVLLVVTICVWPSPLPFANVQFSLFVASFGIFQSTYFVLKLSMLMIFLVVFYHSFMTS
jgi:hypothetical protein